MSFCSTAITWNWLSGGGTPEYHLNYLMVVVEERARVQPPVRNIDVMMMTMTMMTTTTMLLSRLPPLGHI